MSAARRRITKKQLKDDKFVDLMLSYGERARQHQRSVALGLIILLVLVLLGTWGFRYFSASRSQVNYAFSEALNGLSEAVKADEEEAIQASLQAFQEIRDEFSGRKEGRWAVYFVAYCQENLKLYMDAEKIYEEYLAEDPGGEYEIPARLGIVSCNAAVGRAKRQADFLRDVAASEKVSAAQARDWLYQVTQIYMDAGYYESAIEVLEQLKQDAETDENMLRKIEQDLEALSSLQARAS